MSIQAELARIRAYTHPDNIRPPAPQVVVAPPPKPGARRPPPRRRPGGTGPLFRDEMLASIKGTTTLWQLRQRFPTRTKSAITRQMTYLVRGGLIRRIKPGVYEPQVAP